MNSKQEEYLQAMDVQLWKEKSKKSDKTDADALDEGFDALEQKVLNCKLCDLSKSRTKVVFGVGDKKADLLIVGEAPGANEDSQGLPFVGRAGMLLTSIIQAIGLSREKVYITNILKCRPPQNRDPFPSEIDCCTPYLKRQISLIQPKLIVAVGRIAAQFLLKTTETLGRLRGKQHHYGDENTPLIITYHPAYLLRSPREKAKSYQDWMWIKKFLGEVK